MDRIFPTVHRYRRVALGALGVLAFLAGPASAEAPQVVASLAPVHSLVAGVMEGVGQPRLLISGGSSPHTYQMRPSEAAALAKADLVFWVGPALESFLERPIDALGADAAVVGLMRAEGVSLLETREGGIWEEENGHAGEHDHADEHGHEEAEKALTDKGNPDRRAESSVRGGRQGDSHDVDAHNDHAHADEEHEREERHDHDHGTEDGHIWLDADNAKAMVLAIADALAGADPENEAAYRDNAQNILVRISDLDTGLRLRFAPVSHIPYIVFHDAYHYVEARYGLRAVGAITVSPDRAPGAGRVSEIRARIKSAGPICVFSEPQFPPKLVATLIEGTGARTAALDPLGSGHKPGPRLYFRLMDDLGDAIASCLAG